MHAHSLVTLLLLASLVAFLADDHELHDDAAHPLELADARTGGPSDAFLFLPPIADAPEPGALAPDGTLEPEVVICSWSGSACTGEVESRLRLDGAADGDRLSVTLGQYHALWPLPTHASARLYRVRIQLGDEVLGWVDVLRGSESGMRIGSSPLHGDPEEAEAVLIAGSTLPIRFLIGG